MSNNANSFIDFGDDYNTLNVKCVINFDTPVSDFCFSLSTLLTIDTISTETNSEWKIIEEWHPQWQHKSNKIKVSSTTPMHTITIEYHGNILGWCNIIEERRIALSSYSTWTISDASVPIKYLFKLENMEDYFVIKARYDDSEKVWVYGETNHDIGNIIALKKGHYHAVSTENFNFFYLNEDEKPYADNYNHFYHDIMRYYSSLFDKKDINKLDVLSLDMPNANGAYFRNELIVIDKMNILPDQEKTRQDTISLLAHELAHNWFTGADTTTWEDWLNETGAEWAALLYIISLDDKEFFEEHISFAKKNYKDTPVIKSQDLTRPTEGVHTRGVMMFYEIYSRCGIETVTNILKILANLEEHTTASFLSLVNETMGNEISEIIEKGLLMNDYTELFK